MSIGKKLLIAVIFLIFLSFLTTLFFSIVIFRSSYANLEKKTLDNNIERAVNGLSVTTNRLAADTADWAVRDDTYNFALNANDDYIRTNFIDRVFENKNLNLIVVLDKNGKLVHGKAYDLLNHQETAVPAEINRYIASGILTPNTDNSSGISGVVLLANTPLLVSSHAIMTGSSQGTSSGTLIFGVLMDVAFVNNLSQTTVSSISIWQENNPQIPVDIGKARSVLTVPAANFTQTLNNSYAAGYTLIDDLSGNPAIILKTTLPRDVYNQGRLTMIFLFAVLALSGVLFGLLFILIMKKTILTRFDALAEGVSVIGHTGDVSKTIALPAPILEKKDEITDLADDINRMLGKIEETEFTLHHQQHLFERLLLYTPAVILVVDGQENITMANKAFCANFNISESEAIGKHLSNFIPFEDIVTLGDKISEVEGSVVVVERRFKIGENERTFELTIITMSAAEYLVIGRDVTGEREEQEKLYLNDRLASVGEMAAGIAHELNNPLTGIVMLSQLLMQTDFPEDVKKDLNDINSEASRATDVVRNLLAFARKQPPAKRLTQINKIINDVLRLRHYEQTVNNIEVVVLLDPDLPEIMVDNIQIQQVFLNLILNAEYSMIRARKKGKLQVESSCIAGKVVISFTDDGEGIKEENMKKLFQPFFTTKEVGVGTGLGLSLCYGIVKRHGGMIYVKSKYGSGATFIIELPVETSNISGEESGTK
jgi:PAS domain S-box-containing protein